MRHDEDADEDLLWELSSTLMARGTALRTGSRILIHSAGLQSVIEGPTNQPALCFSKFQGRCPEKSRILCRTVIPHFCQQTIRGRIERELLHYLQLPATTHPNCNDEVPGRV